MAEAGKEASVLIGECNMEFEKVISERYSVRNFTNEHLPQAVIDRILAAGHKAPTGCNYQPQRILVLNTDEAMSALKGCTKCHFCAPTAMLVCYNEDESWTRPYDGAQSAPVDAAIVTTHMMLAAHSIGVGTCWVMHFDPRAMRETFSIPDNVIPCALLVMGYPSEDSKPIDMHFDTRPMEDVVFYGSF